MQIATLKLIHDEHQALACVLHALRDAALNSHRPDFRPDFDRLRAMLFYMDEIPARLHHAAEDQVLFPKIRERCPALRPVLDRLQAEHGRAEATVQSLERALARWEFMGDERREAYELPLRAFVEGYLGHMEVEETYVLPVAQDYLTEADWRDLYAALGEQRRAQTLQTNAGHRAVLQGILGARPDVPPQGD